MWLFNLKRDKFHCIFRHSDMQICFYLSWHKAFKMYKIFILDFYFLSCLKLSINSNVFNKNIDCDFSIDLRLRRKKY